MRTEKRKRWVVDSQVQGALLRRCILHWIFFGLASFCLFLPLQYFRYLSGGAEGGPSLDIGSLWHEYKLLIVVLLAILPACLYDLVKLSARFAGPITRLRNEIRRAARGEKVERIQFRDDDFWQDLAQEFNLLLDRLENQAQGHPATALTGTSVDAATSPLSASAAGERLKTPAVAKV